MRPIGEKERRGSRVGSMRLFRVMDWVDLRGLCGRMFVYPGGLLEWTLTGKEDVCNGDILV